MTEIELAKKDNERIKELDNEIDKVRVFQQTCIKNHDNIGMKIWADHIKKLKQERSALDRQHKYFRLSIFIQVVKAYLTKEQYEDCWNRVTQIIENPDLMQKP